MSCWPRPEWVDKWTMYFGDLYQNTVSRPRPACNASPPGAMHSISGSTIRSTPGKPYNQMATETDHRHRAATATPRAS